MLLLLLREVSLSKIPQYEIKKKIKGSPGKLSNLSISAASE
jgi:hypothetical protein